MSNIPRKIWPRPPHTFKTNQKPKLVVVFCGLGPQNLSHLAQLGFRVLWDPFDADNHEFRSESDWFLTIWGFWDVGFLGLSLGYSTYWPLQ